MLLPDFGEFEPFLKLRETMGARALGHFEFFDPKIHLTADERLALLKGAIRLPTQLVRRLDDHTLAFKNARVLVWEDNGALTRLFHLCACPAFPVAEKVCVGVNPARGAQALVCEACLDHLQYQGHNSHRHRHQAYYEKVRAEFDVAAFFQRYPHYPLKHQ